MALSDWRHRGTLPGDDDDRPAGYVPTWAVVLLVAFAVILSMVIVGS